MFDIDRIRSSWERESSAIDAVVERTNEATARRPIRDDGWTTHDILAHIADIARMFLRQIETNTPIPTGITIDIDALNEQQHERNEERAWSNIIAYWETTRDDVTLFLRDCSADIATQPAHLPWVAQVKTAGDLLRALIVHTRGHREELERGIQ